MLSCPSVCQLINLELVTRGQTSAKIKEKDTKKSSSYDSYKKPPPQNVAHQKSFQYFITLTEFSKGHKKQNGGFRFNFQWF